MSLARAVAFTVALTLCGGLGTLTAILAAARFHGLAHTVVGVTAGTAVAAACGYLLDRHTTRKEHKQ